MSFVLERLPETDDELWWAVRAMWGVVLPRHTCGDPAHTAPFTAFADAYWERYTDPVTGEQRPSSTALWHGSRGLSGKSFMLSVLGITKAVLRGSDVNLLGGSLAQSANIHLHIRNALNSKNAPRYMVNDESNTMIRLSNNAMIRPLTASQRTVRGPHPPFLILDEIDEMELEILDAALGQPMPQKNYLGEIVDPYTVMCSTWQNPDGTFTEIVRRFQERKLPIIQWCYKCSANPIDGWLSQKTIQEKKDTIPAEMWRVEYELGEPSIGNRAFDSEAVDNTFSIPFDWDDPDTYLRAKRAKDFEEVVFSEPEKDGRYIVAADWAKEQDYTVVSVIRIDRQPMELCYYVRVNRRPYPLMVKYFNDAMQSFRAKGIHDSTGVGNAISDYLDSRAVPFTMTGEKRAEMLTEYVSAVERGVFKFPRIPSAYYAHKYAQVGDLYSNAKAQGYHLPDEVCSLALAFKQASRSVPIVAGELLRKTGALNSLGAHLDANIRKVENELAPDSARSGEVFVRDSRPEDSFSLLV